VSKTRFHEWRYRTAPPPNDARARSITTTLKYPISAANHHAQVRHADRRRRVEIRNETAEKVHAEEGFVHGAADQDVEARQHAGRMHMHPGGPRHFEMRCGEPSGDDDQCGDG
jgi:hypothetical protein